MKRSRKNFITDSLAFVLFLFLVTTGVLLHYLLPPGSGHSSTIWGLGRHDWGDIHFYIAIGFLGILVIHLFLHWNWIVNLIKGRKKIASGRRALLGFVAVLAIAALAVSPLLSPIENSEGNRTEENHQMHTSEAESDIDGSMTLSELRDKTGVPVSYILAELGLPETTSAETKLGKLRNQYGFEMDRVRVLVAKYEPTN